MAQKDWSVDLAPLNVNEQDLVLRLDVIGNRIQVWYWAAGEPMPDAPQITISDTQYTEGPIAIVSGNWFGSKWLVRRVEALPGTDPVVDFNGDGKVDMKGSDSGLNIGTGKAMEAGTFWSGLIDDVRIYTRAVKP